MLPLDKLSDAAILALKEKGISPEDVSIAIQMDLDFDGNFGESWLLYRADTHSIIRLLADPNSIPKSAKHHAHGNFENFGKKESAESVSYLDELSFDFISDLSVDTFMSSNRLLYQNHSTKRPDTEGMDEEKANEAMDSWHENATTEIAAYSTNTKRQRLFAFCDIVERLFRGDEITEEDQIFEQFNAKCPKCGKVYENQFRKVCTNCVKKGAIFKRLFGFLAPYKAYVALVIFCMLATSAISLINPILTGQLLYDRVIDKGGDLHTLPMLFTVLSAIFALALVGLGVGILQNWANAKMSYRMSNTMKQTLFESIMNLSLSYFNQNPTGRLISRVDYDVDRLRAFFVSTIPTFVINVVNFIGLTIFLFLLNWKMTLIVFIPVPIIVIIFRVMLPKMGRMYTKQWRAASSFNSMVNDSLGGIRVVKAFAKETEETYRFTHYATRLYKTNLKVNVTALTIFPVVGVLIGLSSTMIWGYGGMQVMGMKMSYGDFVTYLGYIGMIFAPLQFFSTFTDQLTDVINAANRMFEVLDQVPEIMDAHDAVEMPEFKGDIEFKNVSFHYNPNRPILKDVNIKINAGDNIGLVGHTGSGKSTIANLITRMYDPITGSILIDGVDLKKIKISSIRRNIAIVSQEIFLFRGTIADNIRYARPDATMEEVIAAAKAANAHDFIIRLPEGYETMVGVGSRSLSGGERQRVSIARALLMSPTILILDEATAAMDTETERLIGDALSRLVEGRTCITIAHRLSTLKDCNYLFAIENGEIAEEGEPEELLARKGVYYKLYTLQSEAMSKVLSGM